MIIFCLSLRSLMCCTMLLVARTPPAVLGWLAFYSGGLSYLLLMKKSYSAWKRKCWR